MGTSPSPREGDNPRTPCLPSFSQGTLGVSTGANQMAPNSAISHPALSRDGENPKTPNVQPCLHSCIHTVSNRDGENPKTPNIQPCLQPGVHPVTRRDGKNPMNPVSRTGSQLPVFSREGENPRTPHHLPSSQQVSFSHQPYVSGGGSLGGPNGPHHFGPIASPLLRAGGFHKNHWKGCP